jgi:hypothetical protein
MDLLLFEMGDVMLALRMEAARRVMEAGESAESGCRVVDAAPALAGSSSSAGDPGHMVWLSDSGLAVRLGRLVGTARVDPRWILPLPGYMFAGPRPPLRGGVGDVHGAGAEAARAAGAFVLDEDALAGLLEPA